MAAVALLPRALGRYICSFLAFSDVCLLHLASMDCAAVARDAVRVQSSLVWNMFAGAKTLQGTAMRLLASAENLTSLVVWPGTTERSRAEFAPLLPAVIACNVATLRHVELPELLKTLATLAALSKCAKLANFRDQGVVETDGKAVSDADYSRAVSAVFAGCPGLETVSLGDFRVVKPKHKPPSLETEALCAVLRDGEPSFGISFRCCVQAQQRTLTRDACDRWFDTFCCRPAPPALLVARLAGSGGLPRCSAAAVPHTALEQLTFSIPAAVAANVGRTITVTDLLGR